VHELDLAHVVLQLLVVLATLDLLVHQEPQLVLELEAAPDGLLRLFSAGGAAIEVLDKFLSLFIYFPKSVEILALHDLVSFVH